MLQRLDSTVSLSIQRLGQAQRPETETKGRVECQRVPSAVATALAGAVASGSSAAARRK
jgi:hypothetical protein